MSLFQFRYPLVCGRAGMHSHRGTCYKNPNAGIFYRNRVKYQKFSDLIIRYSTLVEAKTSTKSIICGNTFNFFSIHNFYYKKVYSKRTKGNDIGIIGKALTKVPGRTGTKDVEFLVGVINPQTTTQCTSFFSLLNF